MKYILIPLAFIIVLVSCSRAPSEGDIQTAIAHTQEAQVIQQTVCNIFQYGKRTLEIVCEQMIIGANNHV